MMDAVRVDLVLDRDASKPLGREEQRSAFPQVKAGIVGLGGLEPPPLLYQISQRITPM
jgi:hypothetical protein